MSTNEMITEVEQHLLHTYNRYPVVFDRAEGVRLYDADGKEYLDAFSGIGVMAFGYGHPKYTAALKDQVDRLTHISNYYYHTQLAEAARKFTEASVMDRVFFTNSGGEAVEGALKTARKYAWLKDGRTDHEIIAMEHSFHGRTFGALSVTGKKAYRDPFEPLLAPVHFAEFNDIDSVRSYVNEKTCAIILEPVQGEGGVYPAKPEFLQELRALCDERDILLIFDEVQCGMGRTGYMFAWQGYGVKPDVLTSAKALGCGVPVGAFAMTQKVADASLVAGDHGSTLGGNPLVCAAMNAVFDIFEEDKILENVREMTPYMERKLDELKAKHACITDRRGRGFFQALECSGPVAEVIDRAREAGVILINAGANVLRIIPPLIFTKAEIDEMCAVLDRALEG
ncbi:MAG: aspartate aminotransferase family protein [Lachnospiraceae bacterium]|nr:aspartate aminotransferase family protein [Lachnospiraceae bacterium]